MRKVILLVLSIVIVFLSIVVFFILNNPAQEMSRAEKEKALTQIAGRKLNLGEDSALAGDTEYRGKYFSYFYPRAAKIYKQTINGKDVNDEGALEYFSFDLDNPRLIIVTEAIQVSSSILKLSDYSSVSLRLAQNQAYKEESVKTGAGISGIGFEKKDDTGFEKTAFFFFNGKIYSISVVGADIKEINLIYKKIISSLRFY